MTIPCKINLQLGLLMALRPKGLESYDIKFLTLRPALVAGLFLPFVRTMSYLYKLRATVQ